MVDRRRFHRRYGKTDQPDVSPDEGQAEQAAQEAAARAEEARRRAEQQASDKAEALRREAEDDALRRAEERARRRAEVEAAREAEKARETAEEQARERAHAAAARKAEAARLAAEQQARQRAEEQARQQAEADRKTEDARQATERQARQRAAEQARQQAEADATRQAAEQQARQRAERQARQRAEADAARQAAEKQARQRAEEQARQRAEAKAEAARKADQARAMRANPLRLETRVDQPQAKRIPDPVDPWSLLREFPVNDAHLTRNRIVTASREDPAHTAFDVLRTRLLQALQEHGWRRVAITSPTKDCGKTFTAANLAISLSRQENCRTLLLDCDMRRPALHRVMGVSPTAAIGDMLRGEIAPQDHLMRLGPNDFHAGHNIAFSFNGLIEPYAAELLQDPRTGAALSRIETLFQPDVMLFDLPPALYYDDVIAFRPLFDGVLLVIGGGITTPKEIKEVERRLGASTPLLGMVLNRAEHTEINRYRY
ncbi:exopolysaccharide biosynthesis protein [Aestuariicoccus sp. KMU-90]|uniref:Exopolysaccharide biosynthesis protein n=2 Tax=Thetidibacter halocola TaxID=2827239 RepID=A0A8J7WAY0_9RHOB|nr:exopolysaccharide biosynthesis protein [Thetidibacter halocola]